MKKKTGIYLVIGIVGIALALSARFLLQDCLSDSQSGAMIGIGAGLFGYGIAKWCVALWGAKNPDLMKINPKLQHCATTEFVQTPSAQIAHQDKCLQILTYI